MPKDSASILVVDDSLDTLELLRRNLRSQGYAVYTASGVAEAIDFLETTPVDLVITDLKMPKIGGLELVRHVRENVKDSEVMMITGYATIESAVTAVKTGAEEYLAKPFTDEELLAAVRGVLEKLWARRAAEPKPADRPPASFGLIGESAAIQKVFRAIEKTSATSASVLIFGESGVGKELVARGIHYASPRAAAPFLPINCGAIPGELLESELFGYEKGAFTGASESRAGFFETADGGTIFLDEVSEMSSPMQVKLLRVLQDGEVWRVGSTRPRQVDVRILAATNKDLVYLVDKGSFREDLYFRLSVITIAVPPLRERGNDVLLLAKHFAIKFAEAAGKPVPQFSDRALNALRSYGWPGNVREVQNLMQRLVVMADGPAIDVADLPALMRFTVPRNDSLMRTLAEVEAEYVSKVLASVDGNKSRAAEILGIDRKTLREKLKKATGR